MRVVFIGCVQFSYSTLDHLLSQNIEGLEVSGVITRESAACNADFSSLVPLAAEKNIPCFIATGNNQSEIHAWLKDLAPDVVYCFGWSYLLKKSILTIPPLGVVGYHPAALPRNRGRHPLIWALALGLTETASTFFFMDEGADSGNILSQRKIAISRSDDAQTLYRKMTDTACEQISEFTPGLISGRFNTVEQDHAKANYWRKRSRDDGRIDWRMSSKNIYNLVRALTRPYVGVHFVYRGKEFKIWKATHEETMPGVENLEPGKVVRVDGNHITVKCGDGVVRLIEHGFNLPVRPGDYF